MVGFVVCLQTDFCVTSQCLGVIWLVEREITLEFAIHDRRGGKVWSRLADRCSDHVG
jgi:hypothetical protein